MTYVAIVKGKSNVYDGICDPREMTMARKIDWTEMVKGLLKSELKRRNVTYAQLAEKLAEFGIEETDANIRNKIARGGFTAVFFVQCLAAIGARTIHLHDEIG